MTKKDVLKFIADKSKQYAALYFPRKTWWLFLIPVCAFLLFFWGWLTPPAARPQDIAVIHIFMLPVMGLFVQTGARKGYRRLLFYPLLLILIIAAEMLNFDFHSQYNLERTLRYGCTLILLLFLADLGLMLIGRCLRISILTVIVTIAMQAGISGLFAGIIVRNIFDRKPLEIDSVSAVLQTDIMEALLFIKENPSLMITGIMLLILIIISVIWYCKNKWFQTPEKWQICAVLTITGIILCFISYKSIHSIVRKGKLTTFALLIKGNYFRTELSNFSKEAKKRRLQPLHDYEKNLVKSTGEKGRFILIIGESNSRDYMSCYGYKNPTTPFLDKMKNDERFSFFNNVYSNHVHTNETLKYLLTEQNQYNSLRTFKVTLFDVLRYCGYFSTFISNQYLYDSMRSPVTAIAQVTDKQIYINNEMDFIMRKNRLDMETVSILKKQPVRSKEIIAIHLMSCHAPYQIRYPAGFRNDLTKDYERAIAYLDQVLKEIFEYAMQDDAVNGVIFIPDHGEDVILGDHDSAGFTIDMTRIPMICYFSSKYLAQHPELKTGLKKSLNKVFTNDLLFDFILDTMGIKTTFNSPDLHLLSDQYRINMENGRTLHGRSKLDGSISEKK